MLHLIQGFAYLIKHKHVKAHKHFALALPGLEQSGAASGHITQIRRRLAMLENVIHVPPNILNLFDEAMGCVVLFVGHPWLHRPSDEKWLHGQSAPMKAHYDELMQHEVCMFVFDVGLFLLY